MNAIVNILNLLAPLFAEIVRDVLGFAALKRRRLTIEGDIQFVRDTLEEHLWRKH